MADTPALPLLAQRKCKDRPLDAFAAAQLKFGGLPIKGIPRYRRRSRRQRPPIDRKPAQTHVANLRQPSSDCRQTHGDCDSLRIRTLPERRRGRFFRPSSSSRSGAGSSETPAHAELEFSCLPFNAIILTIPVPMTRLCCRSRRLKSLFIVGARARRRVAAIA